MQSIITSSSGFCDFSPNGLDECNAKHGIHDSETHDRSFSMRSAGLDRNGIWDMECGIRDYKMGILCTSIDLFWTATSGYMDCERDVYLMHLFAFYSPSK